MYRGSDTPKKVKGYLAVTSAPQFHIGAVDSTVSASMYGFLRVYLNPRKRSCSRTFNLNNNRIPDTPFMYISKPLYIYIPIYIYIRKP